MKPPVAVVTFVLIGKHRDSGLRRVLGMLTPRLVFELCEVLLIYPLKTDHNIKESKAWGM